MIGLRWVARLRQGPPGPERVELPRLDLGHGPVYAVGDVHGCRAALGRLLRRIREDAAGLAGRPHVVLLGDVVDRGPDVSGVIDDLLRPRAWARVTALRGNHEAMMLAFLGDPHGRADWLAQGGFETLLSYGLSLDRRALAGLSRRRAAQALDAHLPDAHRTWIAGLVYGHRIDHDGQAWVLAHAGYDPARGPGGQRPDDLLWGGVAPRPGDGVRLAHGHVIREAVALDGPAVGLDTGAWAGGPLSALRLAQGAEPAVLAVPGGA